MAMHVQSEGDKSVFSSINLRLLLTLFESKPHIIIIFHLKTNRQKLEKYHVNGSQTRIFLYIFCPFFRFFHIFFIYFFFFLLFGGSFLSIFSSFFVEYM